MSNVPETVEVDLITPRHLAGGGDPAWVTVPLHRACGWGYGHDPLMPRVVLRSFDAKATLRLEPDPDGQWWNFTHIPDGGRPSWYASFGARTPVELVAAFTDALTDPATTPITPCDPYGPLQQMGWTPATGADGLASPDGTAYVQRLGDSEEPGAWFVTATLAPNRPVWQARFGEHTPPHLVGAFVAALAEPSPLPRTGSPRSLPTLDPKIITRRSAEVRPVHVAAALEGRVGFLAARRGTPSKDLGPPAPPPIRNGRTR